MKQRRITRDGSHKTLLSRDQEWESHKATITKLYCTDNLRLEDVMEIMKSKHGFNASDNQYQTTFRKWGLRKNTTKDNWISIRPRVLHLQRSGKRVEVLIKGQKQDPVKVRREIKRYMRSKNVSLPALPAGVVVREMVSGSLSALKIELPFQAFERNLGNASNMDWQVSNFGKPPYTPLTPRVNESSAGHVRVFGKTIDSPIVSCAVPHDESPGTSSNNQNIQLFTSPLHRSIICSIANNFAGIEFLSKEKVFQYLKSQTTVDMLRLLLSNPHLYTTQALAINLFNAAIEIGDDTVLELILSNPHVCLEVNRAFELDGVTCAPIAQAARLGHTSAVQLLLGYGADPKVNTLIATTSPEPLSILDLLWLDGWGTCTDPGIYQLLYRLGAKPNLSTFKSIITRSSFLEQLILSIAQDYDSQSWATWNRVGGLLYMFQRLSFTLLSDVTDLIIGHNVKLNFKIHCEYSTGEPATIIDAIALRGHLPLLTKIYDAGAKFTGDTLSFAASSGVKNVVLFVLNHHDGIRDVPYRQLTPLDAAVQQGNKEIIDLIPSDQFSLDMENPPSALFKAASDGNLTRVEHILEQLDPKKPEQLGQALVEAAACKHSDVALRIISSGADVNVFSEVFVDGEWIYGPALFHALYQGDHALCRSLLDSDARVNYRYSKDHPRDENDEAVIADPAIVAAVRSGDEQLVEMIINAGAELNPQVVGFKGLPLAIAIESKNVRVFDLLLRKGCEVNQHRTPAHSGTYRNYADSVLVAAVKTCRIDLVRHVLDKGADPHDEEALVEAVLFEDIFDMILQRHFELYQKERSWGADVLNYAIHESDYGIFEKMSSFGGDPNRLSGSISFSPFGTSIVESEYIGLSFVQYLLNGTDWNCGPETIVSDTTIQSEDNPVSRSTAFLTAIGTGYLPVIELLLKADANVNYPAELGVKRTPLQRAAQVGKIEIVQLLLDYGAEVNAPASLRGGGTALQLAAARGSFPIVRLLHSLNADITADASIVNGRTALEAATEHGRLDILTFLLSEVAGTGPKAVEHASKARSLAEQNGRSYMVEILDAFIRDGSIISQSLPPAQDPNEFSATTAQVPDYNNSDYWEDVDAEALPPTNTEIYQNGISSSPRFSEIFNFDDAMET